MNYDKQSEFDFTKGPEFNKEEGRRLRDQGIQEAMDHADAVEPKWSERAYKFLTEIFLRDHNGEFLAEDVRSAAALLDFPLPPKGQAWGGIMIRAKKDGIIKSIGFGLARNKLSHRRPSTKWIQVKPSERK